MDDNRLRRYQLTCELAFEIMTAADPALARQQVLDDLTEELLAGRANLERSQPLREAFRDALGYSRKVPDEVPGEDTMVAHSQPMVDRPRLGLRLVDGGHA